METYVFRDKSYEVDDQNFLVDFTKWDEHFAMGMAKRLKIQGDLTEKHWCIIHYIRGTFNETGTCPLVYQTCRSCGLTFNEMKRLFPTGYQRGACLLSGISFKDRIVNYYGEKYILSGKVADDREKMRPSKGKTYRIDVFGFLVDPSEWDRDFALNRAREIGITKDLTDKHWKIIGFLRDSYQKHRAVPTIYECCEGNRMEIDEIEALFPMGYHRGAVKIAGLRLQ